MCLLKKGEEILFIVLLTEVIVGNIQHKRSNQSQSEEKQYSIQQFAL